MRRTSSHVSVPLRRAALPLALCAAALVAAPARAGLDQESILMDTNALLGDEASARDAVQRAALAGFTRVRVSISWQRVASFAGLPARPAVDLGDPGAYPQAGWEPYDRAIRLVRQHGLEVYVNLTGFAPAYATPGEHEGRQDNIFEVDASEFGDFVAAAGRRFDGTYVPLGEAAPLPRVEMWSLYNEPNQPGWLQPQWRVETRAGRPLPRSPVVYRRMLRAAGEALAATGHGSDQLLVGELAPSGRDRHGERDAMRPEDFLLAMLCLDERLRPLRGARASILECNGSQRLPGTGLAHHPYDLRQEPDAQPLWEGDITLAALDRLKRILDRAGRRGRIRRGMPIWSTEYGWETVPDRGRGIPLSDHARYLMRAEYLQWRDPWVRSVSQYQLDDEPEPGADSQKRASWQSGLWDVDGKPKPGLRAFQLPIQGLGDSRGFYVWGMVRPGAPGARLVQFQVKPRGESAYRNVGDPLTVRGRGYFAQRARFARGRWRFVWLDSPRGALESLSVDVRSLAEARRAARPLPPTTGRIRGGRDRAGVDTTIRRPCNQRTRRGRCRVRKGASRVFHGRARGRLSRVQVALLRRWRGSRRNRPGRGKHPVDCYWLKDTRPSFRIKAPRPREGCAYPVWVDVSSGLRGWRLRLAKMLPRGGYVLYSRAVDERGGAERSWSLRDANKVVFEVR